MLSLAPLLKRLLFSIIKLSYTVFGVSTWSLSLQVNLWLFIALLVLILAAVYLVICEKFIEEYARCQQSCGNKQYSKHIYSLYSNNSISFGFKSYYDDFTANFLSEIEEFGNLNILVLNKIVRYTYIRRLPKDDVLDADGEGSLYFVMRGKLGQLLSKSNNCTLIKTLGQGGALSSSISSSISILKAFLEAHHKQPPKKKETSRIGKAS